MYNYTFAQPVKAASVRRSSIESVCLCSPYKKCCPLSETVCALSHKSWHIKQIAALTFSNFKTLKRSKSCVLTGFASLRPIWFTAGNWVALSLATELRLVMARREEGLGMNLRLDTPRDLPLLNNMSTSSCTEQPWKGIATILHKFKHNTQFNEGQWFCERNWWTTTK